MPVMESKIERNKTPLYKRLIQRRIHVLRRQNPLLKYAYLANQLQIEPSYLSRFFSDPKVHFSDELLFQMLKQLDAKDTEIEQILILREISKTQQVDRLAFLRERLRVLRLQSLQLEFERLRNLLGDIIREIP
jgi:hypothetical protein